VGKNSGKTSKDLSSKDDRFPSADKGVNQRSDQSDDYGPDLKDVVELD
jgi:hypothetical protein